MLSDVDLISLLEKGIIKITEFNHECLRPSSYLLRIGETILEEKETCKLIDTKSTDTKEFYYEKKITEEGFILKPGGFYLASSIEKVSIPPDYVAILNQLSSFARIGLAINFSSNLIAASFGMKSPSTITFEIKNLSANNIKIYPNVKLCHLSLFKHESKPDRVYNGIYGGRISPTPSNFLIKPSR
ncbi:dCTP deaminase [Sutcliffiella horikoshii]|uniref:dCTP deaminase n=1 Tax=Sutcliffiella horikoshii TaxID=79883 RepID=UPI00384A6983